MSRSPRPLTSRFCSRSLAASLKPLAQVKGQVLGFKWDGSSYESLSRNRHPNVGSLEVHAEPLQHILAAAPTGLPRFKMLRVTFLALHADYDIFGDVEPRHLFKVATESTDNWRIMARHVYELAKAGGSCEGYDKVAALVAGIVLPSGTPPTGAPPSPPSQSVLQTPSVLPPPEVLPPPRLRPTLPPSVLPAPQLGVAEVRELFASVNDMDSVVGVGDTNINMDSVVGVHDTNINMDSDVGNTNLNMDSDTSSTDGLQ